MTDFREAIKARLRSTALPSGDVVYSNAPYVDGLQADDILAMPEMRAIRGALRAFASWEEKTAKVHPGPSSRFILREYGLPDSVIDWVLS